jgi:ribosomal protein S12 methylthiotransferase
VLTGPRHYAYLKVSEGCDRSCTFCAIPSIRGRYVSRPVEDLVSEAAYLAGRGVRELILIAQDLCYYGIDLYGRQMLCGLVSELLKISSFEWIRLHYLYPANFPMDLIPLIRDNPRICRYIDIPVQHISDKILKLMKRSHNGSETRRILRMLRNEIPGAAIRTTLIAGHPGETKREYEELKDFISEFRFDRLGVFPYSHEEGTYSWENYKDSVSEKVKNTRVSELMSIQQEISAGINSAKTGTTIRVMIDRREGDYFVGRSEFDSPEIDQEILISTEYKIKPGTFCDVFITEAREFDLYGRPA